MTILNIQLHTLRLPVPAKHGAAEHSALVIPVLGYRATSGWSGDELMNNLISQYLTVQSLSVLKCILHSSTPLSEQGDGDVETEAACLNSHRKPMVCPRGKGHHPNLAFLPFQIRLHGQAEMSHNCCCPALFLWGFGLPGC